MANRNDPLWRPEHEFDERLAVNCPHCGDPLYGHVVLTGKPDKETGRYARRTEVKCKNRTCTKPRTRRTKPQPAAENP